MAAPTVIRHALIEEHNLHTVTSYIDIMGFSVTYQHYTVYEDGHTVLETQKVFTSEEKAISAFEDAVVTQVTDKVFAKKA